MACAVCVDLSCIGWADFVTDIFDVCTGGLYHIIIDLDTAVADLADMCLVGDSSCVDGCVACIVLD